MPGGEDRPTLSGDVLGWKEIGDGRCPVGRDRVFDCPFRIGLETKPPPSEETSNGLLTSNDFGG